MTPSAQFPVTPYTAHGVDSEDAALQFRGHHPGTLPIISGTALNVSPLVTTAYTLTVTSTAGVSVNAGGECGF